MAGFLRAFIDVLWEQGGRRGGPSTSTALTAMLIKVPQVSRVSGVPALKTSSGGALC